MDTPTPPDAHARLHVLAGQWGGEETVHPAPWDPTGGPATAFVNNRVVLNGLAVVQEYEQYRHGRPTFSGHGLFWWDALASEYVMTWFDSMVGTPANYRGTFDGDVLRLTHTMPHGGCARCTFDCGMPGEYVFLMEVSPDGISWTPAMEGAYGQLNGLTPRKRTRTRPARAKTPRKKAAPTVATRPSARTTSPASRAAGAPPRATKKPATKKPATRKGARTSPPRSTASKTTPTKNVKKAARGRK